MSNRVNQQSSVICHEATLPTRQEYRAAFAKDARLVEGLRFLEGVGHKIASCPECKLVRYEDQPYEASEWLCFDCGIIGLRKSRQGQRSRVRRANAKHRGKSGSKV